MRRRLALIVVALVIVGLYFSGRLDPLLYKVGLNYNTCGQNAFGTVYCGQALTDYNARIAQVQRTAQQSAQQAVAQLHATECRADPMLAGC